MNNRVPVQEDRGIGFRANQSLRDIDRAIAEEAYKEYAETYGADQSFERLCERGGFGWGEIIALLYARCRRLETGKSIKHVPYEL